MDESIVIYRESRDHLWSVKATLYLAILIFSLYLFLSAILPSDELFRKTSIPREVALVIGLLSSVYSLGKIIECIRSGNSVLVIYENGIAVNKADETGNSWDLRSRFLSWDEVIEFNVVMEEKNQQRYHYLEILTNENIWIRKRVSNDFVDNMNIIFARLQPIFIAKRVYSRSLEH